MSQQCNSTNLEHIEALTRGVSLPLSSLSTQHMKLIADAISKAFDACKKSSASTIANGDEPSITALLKSELSYLINTDDLINQIIHSVGRGIESYSFDGQHKELRPDLSIFLTYRHTNFPLNVESKILDSSSGKTIKLYGDAGICRFVDGKYGWGSKEAFMLAYVRGNETLSGTLLKYLKKVSAAPQYSLITPPFLKTYSPQLATSRHGRAFNYIHVRHVVPPCLPGEITLWHLWLK